jgi:uncharacterized protein YjeT (DUF2065 family)
MDLLRWITLAALAMILIEGFCLSLFPEQVRQLLAEADPRSLQLAGLVETIVAVGLAAAVLLN